MTTPRDRYRIVIALDLSEYAEVVLEHAIDQAARHRAPDLHFLTVAEGSTSIEPLKERLAALAFDGLELLRGSDAEWRARLHVRTGHPDEEIVELAGEIEADMVIVGRFGTHRGRLGSIASRVLSSSPCAVLVVGLAEHAVPAADLCLDCARVREESDGERWLCDAHLAPERPDLATAFLPGSTAFTGSGPMW